MVEWVGGWVGGWVGEDLPYYFMCVPVEVARPALIHVQERERRTSTHYCLGFTLVELFGGVGGWVGGREKGGRAPTIACDSLSLSCLVGWVGGWVGG